MSEGVEIQGRKVAETDNAICVRCEDVEDDVWFPWSQVTSTHFDGRGVGSIVVSEWIAREKGLA